MLAEMCRVVENDSNNKKNAKEYGFFAGFLSLFHRTYDLIDFQWLLFFLWSISTMYWSASFLSIVRPTNLRFWYVDLLQICRVEYGVEVFVLNHKMLIDIDFVTKNCEHFRRECFLLIFHVLSIQWLFPDWWRFACFFLFIHLRSKYFLMNFTRQWELQNTCHNFYFTYIIIYLTQLKQIIGD